MPFPWLAFGIMLLLSIGLSAIQYLLRPKPQKGDVFDSKTYHLDGMSNSIEIGAPINVPYGVHKIAPQIRNYYINSKGDDTEIEALLSCGEGVINGIRGLRMNDQSFFSLVSYKREENGRLLNGFWLTFGEKIQKVYRSSNVQEYDLANSISPGFNVTITIKLDHLFTNLFQNASASEPGYVIVYNWKGATKKSGEDIDNTETVQYTGKAQEAGTGYLQLTGCRVTKSHTGGLASVRQEYKINKDKNGAVHETIPGFTKTVVNHQEVGTNVNFESPVTITTVNKVEAFAVVLAFQEGLYNFDDKHGYQKAKVKIGIKWWKNGTSWSGSTTAVTTTRTESATKNHYIKLEKKKNYGYLVDATGAYIEGTEEFLDQNSDWDIIMGEDVLEFTLGGTTYKCTVTKIQKEQSGETVYEGDDYTPQTALYRFKVRFKPLEPEQTIVYQGPNASKASYKFTYQKIEYNNYYETEIAPTRGKLADYRLTYQLPEMEKFGKLDDAKYKIQVEKLTKDRTNSQSGINTMTLMEVQEITIDNLCYPHEAMLGIRFTSNEKISGSINNITCITEGRILKDVQNTGNPDRLSTNYFDFFADVITNKRYGRGKELNLSSAELTDFYAKLAPEAAFADHTITENNKARKRFEVNVNVDFKKPAIDFIQALSICARSNIYWDGVKPLAYVDRVTAPTAIFGSANTIPGSYQDQSMDLTENVNRIYSQFLSKDKNYTHDNVARDLRDEGFTIGKLRPKSITMYGLTDKWRAAKISNYLLRFAKYVQRGNQFQLGGEAITIDVSKTFYYINSKGNCGRILAIAVNNITLDKAFTLESGKAYKALIRKDDGAPHAELTVDVSATGLGSKTIIYFTTIISGVTLATNPIYGIGVAGEYYDTYRCVTKNSKGSSYEIVGALYNAETYRLYQGDPSSDPSTTINIEEITSLHPKMPNPHMAPPNITSLKVVEDKTTMGAVTIHIQRPISTLWSHAEIYISDEDGDDIEQSIGRTRGEPLRITGLQPDIEYTIKAISYSAGNIANPTPFETSITLTGTEPPRVGGLSIINNRGNETEMFGRDFRLKCHDMSGFKSDDLVRKNYENEGIRYLWEVYYSGLPDTVKLGNIKANSKIAYSEITRLNEFDFTLEENIEATKQFWKSYKTFAAAQYNTYYGNPQREITVRCWLINAWGKMSPAPAQIKLINPAPDMKDAAGVVITPTLRKIKGGLRIEFTHPDKEYDIIDFIVRVAKDTAFTTGLKRIKVTSTINVDSSDDDVALAKYKTEIDGLDIKQDYFVEIIPRDPFGKGAASNIASSKPGITNDDDELDLARPTRYDYTKLTITPDVEINDDGKTVINLMVKGEKASETDVDGYILEVRMVKDTAAVTPPTGAEIDAGITAGGKKCEGNTYQIAIDGEAGTGTTDTNYFKKKVPDVKNNWTAWLRVRKQNTSGQLGPWSSDSPGAWVSFVTTKANNAADTTAPAAPTVAVTQDGQSIGITASIATPPADLQGFQFAVKSTAFASDADRLSNKHADIDASAGKAKDTFYGIAGASYYISSRSYDFSKNYSAWVDYAGNPVELAGLTLDSLSEPIAMAVYTGPFTATAADTVTWGNGSKVKIKRTGAATKEYTITNGTTGSLAGTRYIVFNKATSTTAFSVVATPGDNDIVIAKVEPVSSGKANIIRFVGEKEGEYSIGRYSGSFNQLSAMIAYLGKVIIQNGDEGSLNFLDSANKTAMRLKVNSGSDPDLTIMKSGQDAEGNGGADAADPSKVAFSTKLIINAVTSRTIYKKIIDEFIYTIPNHTDWQNLVVAAGQNIWSQYDKFQVGANFPSGYGITTSREITGFFFLDSGAIYSIDIQTPILGSTESNDSACFQFIRLEYSTIASLGRIIIQRVCMNPLSVSRTFPSLVGNKIKITVYADSVG